MPPVEPVVIVVGGTPAGVAAATLLARRGHAVRLYDAGAFKPPPVTDWISTTLDPELAALGLLEKLPAAMPTGQPFGDAHPIRRGPFDELLLANARNQGAEVIVGVHVLEVLYDGDQATGVSIIDTDCGSDEVSARVIVDATGPEPIAGKKQAIRDASEPPEFIGWGYIEGLALKPAGLPPGFWGVSLPEHQVCVGVRLPVGLARADWPKSLPPGAFVSVGPTKPIAFDQIPPHARPLAHRVGDGWLALWGACGAYDPLVMPGVGRGLTAGIKAANVVDQALRQGDVSARALAPFEAEAGNVSLVDALQRGCA